ncbi:MAG TPA: hypothetical protein VFR93_04705 [Candidatus Limnocylindrales bacterium]|jgi:hypothetical protein|nr:hypothetical protein [Candidatus Limnocylindrales bacterium]
MSDPRRTGTRPRARAAATARARPGAGRGYAPIDDEPGRRIGPIPITATGVLIVIALVLGIGWLAYTITVRDPSQIPLLASGTVVLGLVFTAIAVVGGRATWRSSVRGRDARAFGHAIVGGLAWLAAAGCFAAALILFILKGG